MKIILLIVLSTSFPAFSVNQPEWQYYIPSESADISGVYIDPNEALVISTVDNQTPVLSSFIFSDELSLSLDDNIGITGFAIKPTGATDISYSISLSSASGIYNSDEVIECINNTCTGVFDLSEDLSVSENIGVSALNWRANGFLLELSVNTGFFNNSNYINPCLSYNYSSSAQSLTAQLSVNNVTDCSVNSLASTNNSGAYVDYFSLDIVYSSGANIIYPSEVKGLTNAPPAVTFQNAFTEELYNEVRNIQAFDALDTGWIEFTSNAIQVNENAGTFSFTVRRVEGNEFYIKSIADATPGTAVSGADYSFAEVIAQWNHSENTDITYSVTILDNASEDGNKVFYLNLTSASELALIHPLKNLITITIIDDESSDLIFKNSFE